MDNQPRSFQMFSRQDARALRSWVDDNGTSGPQSPVPFSDEATDYLCRAIAESKNLVSHLPAAKVGVVVAVWNETRRMRPRSKENPTGEDSLRIKIDDLSWLFEVSQVDWHLYVVDDGCPENSHAVASDIIGDIGTPNASVHRLDTALPGRHPPLSRLTNASHSIKGGAIMLGCQKALSDGCDAIIYTDADNSVSLAQSGFLLDPILRKGCNAAFGSRSLDTSFVYRGTARNANINFKLLRHIRGMLTPGIPLSDMTSPFKAFGAEWLAGMLDSLDVFDFSFEYDLLLPALKQNSETYEIIGHCFLDSFDESAWHRIGMGKIIASQVTALARSSLRHGWTTDANPAYRFVSEHLYNAEMVEKLLEAQLGDDVATMINKAPDLPESGSSDIDLELVSARFKQVV